MLNKSPKEVLNIISEKVENRNKCLVLGNGPSLRQVNFNSLKSSGITTFATNRVASICKRENWLPSFYAAFFCEPLRGQNIWFPETGKHLSYPGDRESAESTKKDIEYMCYNEKVTCFVHEYYRSFLNPDLMKNSYFVRPVQWNRHVDLPVDIFLKTPRGQFLWHSATTQLFQLVFWLGINKMGIIGQDGFTRDLKINHYEGYVGNEQNPKKFEFANKRMKTLHSAVRHYVVKNGINSYNISDTSVIKDYHQKIDFRSFIEI